MIGFTALSDDLAIVRFPPTATPGEMAEMVGRVRGHLSRAPHRAVYTVDFREVGIFSPENADTLIQLMKGDNPMILRTAFLVTKGAVLSLQVERMLREAKNPGRRTFFSLDSALEWLAEVIPLEQCMHLRAAYAIPLI